MNTNPIYKDLGVIIPSCDSYHDIWPYFFKNFFFFWKDCPLNIYLITNHKTFKNTKVTNIKVGDDISWSSNLKKALERINKKYVLLIVDDLIFKKKISNSMFLKISNWVMQNQPNCLRLHVSTKPEYFDSITGRLPMFTPYKISTMPSIWKKSFLLKILNEEESAWDFEINGTKRAFRNNNFYSLYKSFIVYDNSIIKGKWQRAIFKKLKINHNKRPVMLRIEQFIYYLKVIRSTIFNTLPNALRLKLKKL